MEKLLKETVGKVSVADLILQKHRFLTNKPDQPQIQVVSIQATSPVGRITNDVILEEADRKNKIFQEAKENQENYLILSMDNKNDSWFEFPKKESQYSEYILINGEMADACLAKIWQENEGNRKLSRVDIEKYKRDMLNGSWIPTDEAIGVDFQKRIYNGRHRLTAISEIAKSGIDIQIPLYFTFNVLTTARFVIDSGRTRASGQRLKLILDTNLGNKTGSFCKAIMRGINVQKVKFTESEVALFANKWEKLIEWVSVNIPSARAEVQAAIAKAYLWYGSEKIEPFCERIREIKFVEEGDPAKALFVALQRQKLNRINVAGVAYRKTLAAIHALINGNPLVKLYEKEDDIFEWLSDWELPKKK